MSFFANCKDFKIVGGTFNEVAGNASQYYETTTYAMTGSHNGYGWNESGNGRRPTQFPGTAHPRSQSQSSTSPSMDPPPFSRQDGGWVRPQFRGPHMASLPDPRNRSPEDEFAAHLRDGGARNQFAHPPPLQSSWSAPQAQGQYSPDMPVNAGPWHGRSAPPTPARPIPMARPNDASRFSKQNTGDVLSSSPEDWSRPTPFNAQFPRRAQTTNGPMQATYTPHNSHPRSVRRQASDDEMDNSASDSENEDVRRVSASVRGSHRSSQGGRN
ncbi:hypothetical protein B0H11DRAFT_1987578 [Mycena galericulata]|nr:hypothetical protein B0H11DRAFT_1987578 [Mycena galericulata]